MRGPAADLLIAKHHKFLKRMEPEKNRDMNVKSHSDAALCGNGTATSRSWNVLVCDRSARALKYLAAAIASLFLLSSAQAVISTVTFTPNPVNLNDLDHHSLHTWRIDNTANWDTNVNKLHLHLLDTAIDAGVASFIDDLTGSTPVTDLTDDFTNARFHNDQLNLRGPWLVAASTGDVKLSAPSFTTTATDYNYTFNATKLGTLNAFRQNGNDIAFGLDPDCHYFNDGISFTIPFDLPQASPVPEVSAFVPLTVILGLAIGVQARVRRRSRVLVMAEA